MAYGASTRFESASRLLGIAAIGLCALIGGCSGATYSGPGWSARVIDMETGAPIEGAIVVLRWPLELYSGSFAGWLFVTEAVTDKDGIFTFPAWGPLEAPIDSGRQTRMSPNVPELSIFKSTFQVERDDCCSDTSYLNKEWGYGKGPTIRPSWAADRHFALTRFSGSARQYASYLEGAIPTNGPACAFVATPRIFAAAVMEDQALQRTYGIAIPHQRLAYFEQTASRDGCGRSVASVIGRYIQ